MKFDSTLTISIVLALVALIAPMFTAWINNQHAFKMKKLEIEKQKYEKENNEIKEAFEHFLSAYGKFSASKSFKDRISTQETFYKCIPYVPEKNLDSFFNFIKLLSLTEAPYPVVEKYMQETLLN
ncbi:hypothetical protein, partial [Vagococcus fluvialis]|uniref:hypothetical protein n=1 Tax=Vagococcus fluvialis TaxID=2738 RepID=UPI003B58E60A